MKKENQTKRLIYNQIKEYNHPTEKQAIIFKKKNKGHLTEEERVIRNLKYDGCQGC